MHAARATGVVTLIAHESAFGGAAGGLAMLRSRAGHAALSAMHADAARVYTGARAVRRAGTASVRAAAPGANLAREALAVARAAAIGIARHIYARSVAFLQRERALELASSVRARRHASRLTALLPARFAVVGIITQVDADRSARSVTVITSEAAAADRAHGLPMRGCGAGRPAAAAVVGVILEHHALCATDGLAIATSRNRLARVAADIAGIACSAALARVTRQPIQIRG
jgi:hypothetical protein